ncbi:MAG: ATP-binding protein [archaeon]
MEGETIVISGGPCSGKSTLISELKMRGFEVREEVAREVISKEGGSFLELEEKIALEQARREIEAEGTVFFDRSLVDVIAYCKLKLSKYHKVFFLDRLPFEDDGLRIEKNEAEAEAAHKMLEETYRELGFEIEKVPAMPLKERTDFILERAWK